MKRLQQLCKEISNLTFKIEQDYPELYQFLNESPITIPNSAHPKMDIRIFSDYLNTLKEMLKHHIENHQNIQKK